ncbi:hypothetical protein [Agromyces sp. SYSU T0242]|uniref:hypothetical protein n=1 Tax=Agromyces litoreus TaxID=3158561 RepID=UPI003395945C
MRPTPASQRIGALAAAIGIVLIGSAAVPAPGPDLTVVHPVGDPAQDVPNVQAAVDLGGTVRLKATTVDGAPGVFDFGSNLPGGGFVDLSRDVEIEGEVAGTHPTTISGGFAPFRAWYDAPVDSRISDITFDAPGVAALYASGSTGLEFTRNHVTDVVGLPEWLPGVDKGQAVWVVGLDAVTGDILIADNLIEDVHADNGYGLALFGFSADARIERNEIRGVSTAGILAGVNLGAVAIVDNDIAPGPPRAPLPYGGGNGIIIGNSLGGRALVTDNAVECENPYADGILIAASAYYGDVQDGAVLTGNRVLMHDSMYGAISLVGSVTDTYVGRNRLGGNGAFAFANEPYLLPHEAVASTTFVGNNIAEFDSEVADLLFHENTVENAFFGAVETIIDLGRGNWVSGAGTGAPPTSPGHAPPAPGAGGAAIGRTWDPVGAPILDGGTRDR